MSIVDCSVEYGSEYGIDGFTDCGSPDMPAKQSRWRTPATSRSMPELSPKHFAPGPWIQATSNPGRRPLQQLTVDVTPRLAIESEFERNRKIHHTTASIIQ
jgi:hypothetical protein